MVLDDHDTSPMPTPPGRRDLNLEQRPTGCSRVVDVRSEVTLLGRHSTTLRVARLLRAGRGRGYPIFGTARAVGPRLPAGYRSRGRSRGTTSRLAGPLPGGRATGLHNAVTGRRLA